MREPDHEQRERQATGGSGRNPAADLLWRLIGIAIAAICATAVTTCVLG